MAIITCPECGHRVSDKATACPSCAYPMGVSSGAVSDEPQPNPGVQTIERTGKQFKAMQAFGCLGVIIAIALIINGRSSGNGSVFGEALPLAAIVLLVGGIVGAWWYHG